MNHYYFYVTGKKAEEYLNGVNYVAIWADTEEEAVEKLRDFLGKASVLIRIEKKPLDKKVAYLY